MQESSSVSGKPILIAIPAFNEQGSIRGIVERVRASLPDYDLVVVDDGSADSTNEILKELGVATAKHYCNLGYGRALQTMITYALRNGYEGLAILDADGQHRPEEIRELIETFLNSEFDLLIGSRYVETHKYTGVPFGRRVGMFLFSKIVAVFGRQRIYDTSSGLKVIRKTVFDLLVNCHFVDFHAEIIIYLMRLGYSIGEHPITVAERTTGKSMHTLFNHVKYPLKTMLSVLIAIFDAELKRRDIVK